MSVELTPSLTLTQYIQFEMQNRNQSNTLITVQSLTTLVHPDQTPLDQSQSIRINNVGFTELLLPSNIKFQEDFDQFS